MLADVNRAEALIGDHAKLRALNTDLDALRPQCTADEVRLSGVQQNITKVDIILYNDVLTQQLEVEASEKQKALDDMRALVGASHDVDRLASETAALGSEVSGLRSKMGRIGEMCSLAPMVIADTSKSLEQIEAECEELDERRFVSGHHVCLTREERRWLERRKECRSSVKTRSLLCCTQKRLVCICWFV